MKLAILALLLVAGTQGAVQKLNAAEKTEILKLMNEIRKSVATGSTTTTKVDGNSYTEPKASEMYEMIWDDKLETFAETAANGVVYKDMKHTNNVERTNKLGYGHFFENLYMQSPISEGSITNGETTWTKTMDTSEGFRLRILQQSVALGLKSKSWYSEIQNINYGACDCNQCKNAADNPACTINNQPLAIGHYAAMVKGDAISLGCGIASCDESIGINEGHDRYKWMTLVCTFGTKTLTNYMYQKGDSCQCQTTGCQTSGDKYPGLCKADSLPTSSGSLLPPPLPPPGPSPPPSPLSPPPSPPPSGPSPPPSPPSPPPSPPSSDPSPPPSPPSPPPSPPPSDPSPPPSPPSPPPASGSAPAINTNPILKCYKPDMSDSGTADIFNNKKDIWIKTLPTALDLLTTSTCDEGKKAKPVTIKMMLFGGDGGYVTSAIGADQCDCVI